MFFQVPEPEKKVRKLLPEPKPQPKEEVVLKSGIVFFHYLALSTQKTHLKAHKMCLSFDLFLIRFHLSKFICSGIKN